MTHVELRTEQLGPITLAELGPAFETIDDPALEQVSRFLLDLTADEDVRILLVDLSRTTFFGSAFLAILSRVYSRLSARHGKLALCSLRPHCRHVVAITRLDTLWPTFDTRDEAIAALRQG